MDEILATLKRVEAKLNEIENAIGGKEYLSRADFARAMNLSERTVDRMIRSGEIPTKRMGKRVLIPANAKA